MTIYVDPMLSCLPSNAWPYESACHMFADDLDELHELAVKVGLRRDWFQNRAFLPHYDLTERKRRQAIRLGAVDVDHAFTVRFMRSRDPRA